MLRTPLFETHQQLGGKLIEFGGWEMPVQYTSIVDEHLCVRRAAGVFDICHMGEVSITGSAAMEFLNRTLANDVGRLEVGMGQYSHMCRDDGGVVDDLYVYRVGTQEFLLMINASRIAADLAWLGKQQLEHSSRALVEVQNLSDAMGAIAIQGPQTIRFIDELVVGPSGGGALVNSPSRLVKNQVGSWGFVGKAVWIARTGYTGEDGFEIIAPSGVLVDLWKRTLSLGKEHGLQPCGLGARDTLRTEVCFPLYGHELDEQTTPIEAGLGFFVAFEKGPFVGREVLWRQKTQGTSKKLVAFKMTEKGAPPRPGYSIYAESVLAGPVVSGTQSPSLQCGIGLGYVAPAFGEVGRKIEIEVRGRRYAAEIVKRPIYRRPSA